jgi:hypothetical protein
MLQTNLLHHGHADLVTRELRSHKSESRLTNIADVVYDFYGERRE